MRGGARPGAGRKKGARKSAGYAEPSAPAVPSKIYDNAEDYLAAVVRGEEPPDRDRIAAAKAMLPYQKPKTRAPVKSPTPKQLGIQFQRDADEEQREDWNETVERVRAGLRLVKSE